MNLTIELRRGSSTNVKKGKNNKAHANMEEKEKK